MKNLYIMTVATLLFSSGAAFATEIPGIAVRKVPANVSPLKVDYDNLSDLPIVTEPEGEDEKYSRNSIFFGLDYYGGLYKSADFGCISHVVWGDNGEVYIKNPFSGYDTQTYLVGEMEGDKIQVTFPQKIYEETYPDWENDPEGILTVTDNYYAFKLTYTNDGTNSKMEMDLVDPVITFTVSEGGIKMDGDSFIGMLLEKRVADEVTGEEKSVLGWTGFADSGIVMTKVDDTPVVMPEGAETEKWILVSDAEPRFVDIAFCDEDVYIRGMLSSSPQATLKGRLEDGEVVFDGPQYLGEDNRLLHYAFFHPAELIESSEDDSEPYIFSSIPTVRVSYDAEQRVMQCPDGFGFAFSTIAGSIFLMEGYAYPEFIWQDMDTPMTPDNPEILSWDYYEEYGFGGVSYCIPLNSVDGRLLETSRLYYNLYIDGEPYIFYPDEYPDLDEPMTDVPYSYEDSMIYNWGDLCEAVIYAVGFEHIGVRSIYDNRDGTREYSDIVYDDGTIVGIPDVEASAEVVSVEYYNLGGVRIERPVRGGISIRIVRYSDGSLKTSKVVM